MEPMGKVLLQWGSLLLGALLDLFSIARIISEGMATLNSCWNGVLIGTGTTLIVVGGLVCFERWYTSRQHKEVLRLMRGLKEAVDASFAPRDSRISLPDPPVREHIWMVKLHKRGLSPEHAGIMPDAQDVRAAIDGTWTLLWGAYLAMALPWVEEYGISYAVARTKALKNPVEAGQGSEP